MNDSILDQLKKYSTGQMSAAELQAFESRLASDPEFAKEVATWAAIYTGLEEEGDRQLDSELSVLGNKLLEESGDESVFAAQVNQSKIKATKTIPRWVYGLAATLLLLLLAWPIYQRFSEPDITYASAGELYETHYQSMPLTLTREDTLADWQKAYQQNRYKDAIPLLRLLLSDTSYERPSYANLFLGLSFLGTGDAASAIAAFEQVNPDSYEWEHAQWYSTLAYMKTGNTEKAKQFLREISKQKNNPRSEEASLMLKQLKE
ncbi:MAG: tetratricopeptide repeat protein [Saprospiraceae bacterium]|nr:tetratricopeptide repeat protein [Saprospiraceae bacterium]MCB9345309.1 tetratricopeptide repeat protein [Lewinellaceae bacterium]